MGVDLGGAKGMGGRRLGAKYHPNTLCEIPKELILRLTSSKSSCLLPYFQVLGIELGSTLTGGNKKTTCTLLQQRRPRCRFYPRCPSRSVLCLL